ncbi:helix-turn-helix transcriptional regulator [Feifania hominis]|uniref:WYL domain-containing protein n=1 Tax=Feifania hominis TaxID=2763660 RepID=A0A926DEL4_9FIRM|nr:WYL domain-containing protein [Feifania hominis]MBC8535889.1 WYL domain-containing protein [Feifania hominis]
MPKAPNQKLKLLHLMQILLEQTDENHALSISDIIDKLARCGITAERKSLYDDLEALRAFGLDIETVKSRSVGYYIASRSFEPPELKLLVDAVQSCKFITAKKSAELIKKIESLTSVHEARLLQRQVYVQNRVKTMNESVYYNIDTIHSAISAGCKIRFQYVEWTVEKNSRPRRGGRFYEVSPYALVWDDEFYYLVAFETESASVRHYRVDKMKAISVTQTARDGAHHFADLDMALYARRMFGMWHAEDQVVRLRFANRLVGVVIDRFGRDIPIVPDGDDRFTVTLTLATSPQFFAWIMGFGSEAEILSPPTVRQALANQLEQIAALYR